MKKHQLLLLVVICSAFFLRFFKLNFYPPGLYSDETALGYNAYSILETGRDEFGKFLPLTLRSFGDYKPPLSSYLMIPSIFIFGLNEFSVRFPFALSGTLSVLVIYLITKEIFQKEKEGKLIALLSASILAISPWHLGQTRSAMLVGLEIFFNALGVYLFLQGLKKSFWLFFSSLSFSLAVYAYYGSRITAPLIILGLLIIFRKEFLRAKKNLLIFLFGFLALLPLFLAIYKDPQTLLGRARYMSIFYDKNVFGQLWQASTIDGQNNVPVLASRFFHNKPFYYFKDILRRWLQHFEWSFLFIQGDLVAPFYIPRMGLLYLIEWPFLLLGLFYLFKEQGKTYKFVLFWLLVAPFTAALTFMTPAANRSFNMIFPIYIIIAYGLIKFLMNQKQRKYWVSLITTIYFLSLIYYLYHYYHLIPWEIPDKWHYGCRELVKEITKVQDKYQKVILSDQGGPPYIFLLFYQKYDPRKYWQTMKIDPFINNLGWGHIDGFDKYEIPRDALWRQREKNKGILYITYQEEVADDWQELVNNELLKINMLKKIYYPNGKVAYKIFDLQQVNHQ